MEMIKNTTFRHRQRRDAKIYVVRLTLGLRPPNLSHPVTLISLKVTMSRPVTLIYFKVTNYFNYGYCRRDNLTKLVV